MFETEVRQVGTSLGILIPSKVVKHNHLKPGKKITVALMPINEKAIKEAFGMARGAGPYVKEKWSKYD